MNTHNIYKVAQLFGRNTSPVLLKGGQREVYKVDNIVLKPTNNPRESEELAELVQTISAHPKLRIPRSVKSFHGNWVELGHAAWEFLEGTHMNSNYAKKLQICDFFAEAFEWIKEKPNFINLRKDSWSTADRVTWGELEKEYPTPFQNILEEVTQHLLPLQLKNQIIHGDITGNILFDEEDLPAVIDLTLYWRPKDYAKALLVVDAITWENANPNLYESVSDLPKIDQLLLRAGLRRIIENSEHVEALGKDPNKALNESKKYLKTLQYLNLL